MSTEDALEILICPHRVLTAIRSYRALLIEEAQQNLTALYVFGSLARGCYGERTSDIDLMAVSCDSYSVEAASRIARLPLPKPSCFDARMFSFSVSESNPEEIEAQETRPSTSLGMVSLSNHITTGFSTFGRIGGRPKETWIRLRSP